MDEHLHTEEINKIAVDYSTLGCSFKAENIIPENLNYLEQLGLYLMGIISRGRLCELWGSGFISASEIVVSVINGIKHFKIKES